MILADPATLRTALGRHQRLLGLDLGEKTIGLALSDPGLSVASPVSTIRRTKFTADAKELLKLVAERQVGGLVIGLPLNMDGTEGPRAQATHGRTAIPDAGAALARRGRSQARPRPARRLK